MPRVHGPLGKATRLSRQLARMISGNFRTGGVGGAARVLAALGARFALPVLNRLMPARVHCPCCGWRGFRFLPFFDAGYVTFNAVCPSCRSHGRHRGHARIYRDLFRSATGRLLYIAPERNVAFFRGLPGLEVETSQYPAAEDADYAFDLCAIDAPDESWDLVICHRVIEHVPDDRLAMRELHRVLRPGGTLVFSVPITWDLEETIEFGRPNPLETDHYYRYGKDFDSRIPSVFAEVDRLDFSTFFTPAEFRQLGLLDDVVFVGRRAAKPG